MFPKGFRILSMIAVVLVAMLLVSTVAAASLQGSNTFTLHVEDGTCFTLVESSLSDAICDDPVHPDRFTIDVNTAGGPTNYNKGNWVYELGPNEVIDTLDAELTSTGVSTFSTGLCMTAALTDCVDMWAEDFGSAITDYPLHVDFTPNVRRFLFIGISQFTVPGTGYFDDVEFVGHVAYFRPVHSDDVLSETAGDTVFNLQTRADASVFIATDGVVANLRYESDGWAFSLINGGTGERFEYSAMGTVYVAQGDIVAAGCQAGLASSFHSSYFGTPTSHLIFETVVNESGDWHDWAEPNLMAAPCNAQNRTANCLNPNPNLDSELSEWNTNGFTFLYESTYDSGVDLLSNGAMWNNAQLEVPGTFYVTVGAQSRSQGSAQLTFTVGDASSSVNVNSGGDGGTFDIVTSAAMSPTTADFDPDIFKLTVTNTTPANSGLAPATIRVTFVCLNEGDVLVAPPSCYFNDSATGLEDAFTGSSGVTFEPPGQTFGGAYIIPNGDDIRASVSISAFSDADTDYEFAIRYFSISSGADMESEVTVDIIDSETEDPIQAVGVISSDSLLDGIYAQEHTVTFTLDEAESVVGDLVVANTSSGSDVSAIKVTSICLKPVGGVWPGYADADTSVFGLLTPDCTTCSVPGNILSVPGWLGWLGCLLNYLIRCILVVPINAILTIVNNLMNGLGLLGRWLAAVIGTFANWAYLAGSRLLANLLAAIMPIVNSVLGWLFSQHFFRALLDTLAIAGAWLTALWNMFVGVLFLVVYVINLLGSFVGLFLEDITIIYDGFVAGSSSTVLIPDCSDPGDALYHMCLGFDILNFLVVQVPALIGLVAAIAFRVIWREISLGVKQIEEVGSRL